MRLVLALIFLPFLGFSQHKSLSYELVNEVGSFKLISLTYSHKIDNTEGITYVVDYRKGDTLYQINQFLNGWVALSNNGQTIAHLISEIDKEALEQSQLTFFRFGKPYPTSKLGRLASYELAETKALNRLPGNGWLRRDSVYHKMAANAFYSTDDKLFLSFEEPKLEVIDLNLTYRIFTGRGVNHFYQNYYSIPNPPYRTYMESEAFFPPKVPRLKSGNLPELIARSLKKKLVQTQDNAGYAASFHMLLKSNGKLDIRSAFVYSVSATDPGYTGKRLDDLSDTLKSVLESAEMDVNQIPPNHLAWIFETIVWLK